MRGDDNLRPRKSRFAVVDVSKDEGAAAMGASHGRVWTRTWAAA